jgi:hypothetical protein
VIVSLRGRPASERAAFGDIVKKLDFWSRAQFWGPFGKQTPQVRQRPFFKLGNGPPRSGPASAMALSGDCVAPRNYRSAGIKCVEMIRVILTDEACDAIASTLPKGAARWPTQRDRGQCFSQVEAAVVDRMRVTRVRGESYSESHLAARRIETSDLK